MNNEQIKKYSADKIFLVALFACSLFFAWTIVKARQAIRLTKPIELPYSGLSIQMPDKNGWVSDKKWQFKNNSFTISSIFAPNSAQKARMLCTYQLASARKSAADWLKQIASETGTEVTEFSRISGWNTTFDWAYIEESEKFSGIIAATANLGYGRWLDINIIQIGEEKKFTQEIFEKIAQSTRYEDNKLLKAGTELITKIKNKGLSGYLYFDTPPAVYLIQDIVKRDVGFAIEAILATDEEDAEIQMQASVYLRTSELSRRRPVFRQNNYLDEASFFQSDDYLQEYILSNQTNLPSLNRITVSDGNFAEMQLSDRQYELHLGPAVMPGAVIDSVFASMLKNDTKRILIDVLSGKGQITPVVISKKEDSIDDNGSKLNVFEVAYTSKDSFEKVYLDRNLQTIKKEIKQNGLELLIERSSTEELIRRFPERADFIMERTKTIKNTVL